MGYNINLLQKLLDKIELTKNQRKRAEILYTNICKALKETGLDIDFYPQGSFATKTVVRPFLKGKDKAYDVDVICEVKSLDKDNIRPDHLMSLFQEALDQKGYAYIQYDKCFTVEYANQEGVDFSIDIIPSVPESPIMISRLLSLTAEPQYVPSSIAIPDLSGATATWITNNPAGYRTWFENQVRGFEKRMRESRNNKNAGSIEDLPEDKATNLLCNIIKLMKRHRDVFYSRKSSDLKPSSIVISTLVASLAPRIYPTENEGELLSQIIEQLSYLKNYQKQVESYGSTISGYVISDIILRRGNQWEFKNPTNGLDNILSSWNENPERANHFFDWITKLTTISQELTTGTMTHSHRAEVLSDSLQLELSSSSPSEFQVDNHSVSSWRASL